jgi:dsDNA-specific endonuclease/ATPase MutS2
MSSPRKTLLIEKISYVEEALKHLQKELRNIVDHIDLEYQKVSQELEIIELKENEVDEETFIKINDFLQDAWTKAMLARNRLQELDEDFLKAEELMEKRIMSDKK